MKQTDEVSGWDSSFYPTFLDKYWQKKPLLIRQAVPDIQLQLQLHREDYLSLAKDEDVESRVIYMENQKWVKEYGPFPSKQLRRLGDRDWTILIQEADRHIPRIANLWRYLPFIPNWRRDDIMVSFSEPGGGIGAHVDNYDVFLLQASGYREWSIENAFLSHLEEKHREVPNVATRLLRNFQRDQSWLMSPGDMLYLPPRIPHQGITMDGEGCTTISFGFQSPNMQNLITSFWSASCQGEISENSLSSSNNVNITKEENKFYRHQLSTSETLSPSCIPLAIINDLQTDIRHRMDESLSDTAGFSDWLGKYLSSPVRFHARKPRPFFLKKDKEQEKSVMIDDDDTDYEEDVEDGLDPFYLRNEYRVATNCTFSSTDELWSFLVLEGGQLRRCEGVRMFSLQYFLYANGERFHIPEELRSSELLDRICSGFSFKFADVYKVGVDRAKYLELISPLLEKGFVYPVDSC